MNTILSVGLFTALLVLLYLELCLLGRRATPFLCYKCRGRGIERSVCLTPGAGCPFRDEQGRQR